MKPTILLILLALILTNANAYDRGFFKGDRAKPKTNKHRRKVQRHKKPGCFKRYSSVRPVARYSWMGI